MDTQTTDFGVLRVASALEAALQRSLQNFTASQFFAHFLRQLMAKPQAAQVFCGN
jgi:hypothetical protein